jgi:hypothetical protein
VGTVTFMGLKLSHSELAKTVIDPVLRKLVTDFTGVRTDYGTTATLPSLEGLTKNAQQGRKDVALGALRQVITAVVGGQQTIGAGGAQLTVAKTQLVATEASARAAGFDVLPNGVVRVSQQQRAYCKATWNHGGRELWRMLVAWAAQYTAQINGTLAQASTVDSQIATALVSLATEYLSGLFEKKPKSPAVPALPTAPTSPTPVVPAPGSPPLGTGTTPLPVGGATAPVAETALAGVGSLGGAGGFGSAGAHLGGAGLGVAGLGAAAAGTTVGLAGTPGAGVVGVGTVAAGAGAGRGFGGAGVAPMGLGAHGGAGQGQGDHGTEDWLVEEGDSWGPGDAPDGVIV